ncbi:uncharacterized protein LOC132545723 [Ylistrum balloti]|uniref:uncharacterized protein LOC132545723 n=1 Tax=Ylistrum balloti TaxID=509963 RepID=UPI002905B02D|nr:uncharacterized protein LOC132545723 [Ylistrum balloti]
MYTDTTREIGNHGQARGHSTIQHGLVYQMRKSRGINWTHAEKIFLLHLCAAKARIIEEKKSDSNTLRMKAACWRIIYDQFSAKFGRKRTLVRIKEQWKRMKLATRAEQRDREQETLDSSTGNGRNTQEVAPTKYYGESAEIIAQVKKILNEVANSNFSFNPVQQTELSAGETDAVIDDVMRFSDIASGEISSGAGFSVPDTESTVIKIEIDDDEEVTEYDDDCSQTRKQDTPPELATTVVDFNNLEEVCLERHGNSEPTIEHAHTPTSAFTLATDDVAQIRFSTEIASNASASIPEVNKSSYDPEQSSEHWGTFRKLKSNFQKNDYLEQQNVSRLSMDNMLLEYARTEHEKKMEYLKMEHEMRMEILKLEKEAAAAKLRKANFKLSLTGANAPT